MAVADVTGWTPGQVWLHVRWWREQRGQTFRDRPYGGTTFAELWSALERAGYQVKAAWPGRRRMRYEDFARTLGREGVWIVQQPGHFAVHRAAEPWRTLPPGRHYHRILEAWRVTRLPAAEAAEKWALTAASIGPTIPGVGNTPRQ